MGGAAKIKPDILHAKGAKVASHTPTKEKQMGRPPGRMHQPVSTIVKMKIAPWKEAAGMTFGWGTGCHREEHSTPELAGRAIKVISAEHRYRKP